LTSAYRRRCMGKDNPTFNLGQSWKYLING